jgi:hypothetical protein
MDDDWFNSLLAERDAERRREQVLLWARLEREAAEHAARYTRPAHYVHPSAERNRDIWVARHRDGLKLREIGAKFGLTGVRIRMIVLAEDRRRERAACRHPKSRPIDMGGIRDQWQHWTPETNAIELGLIK